MNLFCLPIVFLFVLTAIFYKFGMSIMKIVYSIMQTYAPMFLNTCKPQLKWLDVERMTQSQNTAYEFKSLYKKGKTLMQTR